MKAVFTLIPSESRRLIGKAVAALDEVKEALKSGYVVINGGTTNAYIAQEILGKPDIPPQKFTAGTNTHRVLCATNVDDRYPFPIVLYKGKEVKKTYKEIFEDFHINTVMIKGGNCVDPDMNVGVVTSGFDGGTVGNTLGYMSSTGLDYVLGVGLEKLIPSVPEAVAVTGAKTFDYSMGANFGIFLMPAGSKVVTEIQALKLLANVDAKLVASGGIAESAGSVVLTAEGAEGDVKKAIALVESIKGEPLISGMKGTCKICPYPCTFQGKEESELPPYLQS